MCKNLKRKFLMVGKNKEGEDGKSKGSGDKR